MTQAVEAYPAVDLLLRERHMTVADLHRELRRRGMNVNLKSLYRLKREQPLDRLDMQVAGAICALWNLTLSGLVQLRPVVTRLRQMSQEKQERLALLMDLNN